MLMGLYSVLIGIIVVSFQKVFRHKNCEGILPSLRNQKCAVYRNRLITAEPQNRVVLFDRLRIEFLCGLNVGGDKSPVLIK